MFLLVGLGNPGDKYAHTRHNAGFLVLDALAQAMRARFSRSPCRALVAQARLEGREVLLAKPRTYMNASGMAVAALMRRYGIQRDRLLVIADDLDLPLGVLRLRRGGGSGGHHGLDSIIAALGGKEFARLRLGLGRPDGEAMDYVLDNFRPAEKEKFHAAIARAAEAVQVFVRDGLDVAMNQYNRIHED